MIPFTRHDYIELIQQLDRDKIKLLKNTHRKQGCINIRHDVDDNLLATLDMAEFEYELGIRSTYFFLNTAPYWGDKTMDGVVKMVASFGHEIGWHNNAITESITTGKSLQRCIADPLSRLRQSAEVVGTASHGDPLCYVHKYLNYYAFSPCIINERFNGQHRGGFELKQFGLTYEAYHTGHTHYISDSGGNWQQQNGMVLKNFAQFGGKLQILIHPQWWKL